MYKIVEYELIDKIRRRPGMYIGNQSPNNLMSFLSGYYYHKGWESELTEGFNSFDFGEWVAQKYGYYESTSGWGHMIEDQREDKEEALWLFYELVDEYRSLTHPEIARLEYKDHYPLNTSYIGYSRKTPIRGTYALLEKPRPAHLIIRKMRLKVSWYALIAIGSAGEVMAISNSEDLDSILSSAKSTYGIESAEWTIVDNTDIIVEKKDIAWL